MAPPAGRPNLRLVLGSTLLSAVIDLDGRPHYVHSGWFLISVANLVVILVMLAVFALAIAIPFPHGKGKDE
jgi:hypothetical protein